MRIKLLTALFFGLLLAAGWTNSMSAQVLPGDNGMSFNAPRANGHPDAVKPKSYYDALTYTWDNGDGQGVRTSKATDIATDPYQIYELLRFVYRDKRFPGPSYSAYAADGTTREDPVYYGPIEGGWNLTQNTNPATDVVAPTEEGYTALVVSVKNNLELEAEPDDDHDNDSYFNNAEELITYLGKNIKSVQLLTDGLRIGEGQDVGTVFNVSGEYNRFFFLSKGQARKKNDWVKYLENRDGRLYGEQVPFKEMFEQFSPTTGKLGTDEITDFYSQMIAGEVYKVQHDCSSVLQNEHYFAMAGKEGTTAYAMNGLNLFIPDYRLLKWKTTYTYQYKMTQYGNTYSRSFEVDGRDQNPYKAYNGSTFPYYQYRFGKNLNYSYFGSNFAVYDTVHAPMVGLYLINLEAVANKVDNSNTQNKFYFVDLDWTSSLNEMSGSAVSQDYVVYLVETDPETGVQTNVPVETVNNCTDFSPHLRLNKLYQQQPHSYTLTFIIQGTPTASAHPGFVAMSNQVTVIIPGYEDFMQLNAHHFESDFVIEKVNGDYVEKNYYRNYLQPENDIANGITRKTIKAGNDTFILYRNSTDGKYAVAKIKFAVDSDNKVRYKITYFDYNEDYNSPNFPNGAQLDDIINSLINNQ